MAFVCVGTPSTYSGDADLSAVWHVLDELPEFDERAILVMKSTVPVGTGEKIRHELDGGWRTRGLRLEPGVPRRGDGDRRTSRSRTGSWSGAFAEADGDAVAALYEPLEAPVVRTDIASAEMIKLASNAFLMTRISFINEIANVCEVDGRRRRRRGAGHRARPPARAALPPGRDRVRRLVLPEGLAGAQAARRRTRATTSSS